MPGVEATIRETHRRVSEIGSIQWKCAGYNSTRRLKGVNLFKAAAFPVKAECYEITA